MSSISKPLAKLPKATTSIKPGNIRHKLNLDCDLINSHEDQNQHIPQPPAHRHTRSYGRVMPSIPCYYQNPIQSKPSIPITPCKALLDNYSKLTPSEYKELTQYKELYFFGLDRKDKDHGVLHMPDGYYNVIIGDHLIFRYEILEELGQGSFGTVVKCRDHKTAEVVAIKIIRKTPRIMKFGRREAEVLDLLQKKVDDVNSCVVEKIDQFYFREHLCIVFELLAVNLYDFLKRDQFQGILPNLARRIITQILIALKHSHSLGIIHCDIKPENIVFKQENKSGIKLIDFGSTCTTQEPCYGYIQSRFYRAPEVILESDYNETIDMWSVGCVVVEMVTGWPLFPGEDEAEVLDQIVNTIGQPPKDMIHKSKRSDKFFDRSKKGRYANGYERGLGIEDILEGLDNKIGDFVKKCIVWDKDRRMTAEEALMHPWIRGTHLA